MRRYWVIVFVVILIPACESEAIVTCNPATGKEEMVFISPEQERNMGRNIDREVCKKFDEPVDPLVQERISKIGEKLAKGSDRKDVVYRFKVIKGKEKENYNAFAVPGGYIYMFDDLVDLMKDDEKIAAIFAHEMAHVECRHSLKRLQAAIGTAALMLLGVQTAKEPGTMARADKALAHLMSAYSRQEEREADELSVKYLDRAGYDEMGIVNALKELQKLRKKGSSRKYSVYRSHPYLSERVADANSIVKGHRDFDAYINSVRDKDEL